EALPGLASVGGDLDEREVTTRREVVVGVQGERSSAGRDLNAAHDCAVEDSAGARMERRIARAGNRVRRQRPLDWPWETRRLAGERDRLQLAGAEEGAVLAQQPHVVRAVRGGSGCYVVVRVRPVHRCGQGRRAVAGLRASDEACASV